MRDPAASSLPPPGGNRLVRLRTLTLLRWWAIIGQLSALIIAQHFYGLKLETSLCYMVVGVSTLSNLVAYAIYPETKRLPETETLLFLLFDTLQLGLMLHLTGGLNNPFSILIVGPVTIAASVLSSRATVLLGVMTIAIVSILVKYHLPLETADGILTLPDIFRFGAWSAIVIAVIFLGVFSRLIVTETNTMSEALQATQMALAREQKLTDLSGVVAAAAHEMGTPLATIKLASAELRDELEDRPDLREDAVLINQQADRCRDILREMGRTGKDDQHMHSAPLMPVVEEAAEPHIERGKSVHYITETTDPKLHPEIFRRPEIIHGLRNLIQNAVDFAYANVWIEGSWDDATITIRIMDDGPGFPTNLLRRIGEPYMWRAPLSDKNRPGYEGMGMGLFIAKTLLERTGAEISFANGPGVSLQADDAMKRTGAFVEVSWPRQNIDAESVKNWQPIQENQQFQT